MLRLIGIGVLATFFLAVVNTDAQQRKGNIPGGAPIDSSKLPPGTFVGTLKSLPSSDRMFTVEIETTQAVPTAGGRGNPAGSRVLQAQQRMIQAQQRLAQARTPQQRQQAMNQFLQAQMQIQRAIAQSQGRGGAGYKLSVQKKAIDFQASDKVKVRTLVLPEKFDEKGTLQKYTQKELAELKGKDKGLPGYESSLEKLEVGQIVQLTLAAAAAPGKSPNKDADGDLIADKTMQVKQILVLKEGTGGPVPPRQAKKAK
jgi:hypothetical protein